MNFVHIADVHFDEPFTVISDRANLGQERRLAQRKAFKKVIEYIKENKVEYLFISGDLYEHDYIRESTIKYINDLFKEIPNTKIYITPGNHDPYLKDSYYKNYNWENNVKIFTNKLEIIQNDDVNIYGYGFNDYELEEDKLENINILENNKINILITHGDIYNKSKYNSINLKELEKKGFNYIALGHIHKRDNYYPGSLISNGFDELGEHGFIYGEINNNNLITNFIKADEINFIIKDYDITDIISEEELIEKLNEIKTENNLYEINLIGYRNFIININIKLIQNNIIKIKDSTKLKYEIKENNNTLKGLFIKILKNKMENKEITQEQFEKIQELGINSLEK